MGTDKHGWEGEGPKRPMNSTGSRLIVPNRGKSSLRSFRLAGRQPGRVRLRTASTRQASRPCYPIMGGQKLPVIRLNPTKSGYRENKFLAWPNKFTREMLNTTYRNNVAKGVGASLNARCHAICNLVIVGECCGRGEFGGLEGVNGILMVRLWGNNSCRVYYLRTADGARQPEHAGRANRLIFGYRRSI
jgi:hypothetical protein